MDKTIRERVMYFTEYKHITANKLATRIGMSQSVIQSMIDRGTEPSSKTIVAILKAFPELSAEWLLRGEGEMIKSENSVFNNVSIDASYAGPNAAVAKGDNAHASTGADKSAVLEICKALASNPNLDADGLNKVISLMQDVL